jgi:hypothetical protein
MYTDAGDDAVSTALAKVEKEIGDTVITEDNIYDYIAEVSDRVVAMGKGQSNPSKNYGDDDDEVEQHMVHGFNEVHDTVVRECIYDRLMERSNNVPTLNNVQNDEEEEEESPPVPQKRKRTGNKADSDSDYEPPKKRRTTDDSDSDE